MLASTLAYGALGLVAAVVLARGYDRIRHPFWARQPVMHLWNVHSWLSPQRVLQTEVPPAGRYPAIRGADMAADATAACAVLLASAYSGARDARYTPGAQGIAARLSQGGFAVLVPSSVEAVLDGCITSMPTTVTVRGATFGANYIDHLCVARERRRIGLAPALISSIYAGARRGGAAPVFIFKREGNDTATSVPLCRARACAFPVTSLARASQGTADVREAPDVREFTLALAARGFTCAAVPDARTLVVLLADGGWRMDSRDGHWFMFRDGEVAGSNVLECVCAVKSPGSTDISLVAAFQQTLASLAGQWDEVVVEGLGDAMPLLAWARCKCVPVATWSSSYHLYNYACWPVRQRECCLVV